MSDEPSHEGSQSDDSSTFSDEVFLANVQIPQINNKFDDINEFWASVNTTSSHASVSFNNYAKAPNPIVPNKCGINLSNNPTPSRVSQTPINKYNNSPIYVGTSTEETPRRLNSSESCLSEDYYLNDDSDSSSDDITFVDTPIPDKANAQIQIANVNDFKLSPIKSDINENSYGSSDGITFVDTPVVGRASTQDKIANVNDFKLSPIKNEPKPQIINEDSSISDDEVNLINSYIDNKNDLNSITEKNRSIIESSPKYKKNKDEDDIKVNLPLPKFSISNSSDSDSDDSDKKVQLIDTHISHTKTFNDQNGNLNSNNNQKEIYEKNRSSSKPAFASPKRSSNGLKEETIITELSPFISSKRKSEDNNKNDVIFPLSRDNQEEERKDNNPFVLEDINETQNQNPFFDNDESDDFKADSVSKKNQGSMNEMNEIIINNNKNKKSLVDKNSNNFDKDKIENEEIIQTKRKQSKSPYLKGESKKKENKSKPETPKTKIETRSSTKLQSQQQKLLSEAKQKSKIETKSKFKRDVENDIKSKPQKSENKSKARSKSPEINKKESRPRKEESKSKSKTKLKSVVETNSHPPKPKSKLKLDSRPKSPSKSNSQPTNSKSKVQKRSKIHYDFSNLSDDENDEERISNLIQIPSSYANEGKDANANNDGDDSDLPIALRRRKRVIVKPLKFWCGEHIVYGLSEDGFRTFQNVSIPDKLRKLKKGEIRVMSETQKKIAPKEECARKLTRIEGNGLVIFQDKVIDFNKSNEIVLDKGTKCNVACKGDFPLIFKVEEI